MFMRVNSKCAHQLRPPPPRFDSADGLNFSVEAGFQTEFVEDTIAVAMTVTVREMRPEEARRFLEIRHASVRGIAAKDYPTSVVEAWARPITDQAIERFLANRDGEIRLIAEIDVNRWASARSWSATRNCGRAMWPRAVRDVGLGLLSLLRSNELDVSNSTTVLFGVGLPGRSRGRQVCRWPPSQCGDDSNSGGGRT